MIYNREINDDAQIQCIILYTLSQCNRALRYDDLINLIFENCNINFVEFQIALANLQDICNITKSLDDDGCDVFSITSKGTEAIKYLDDTIPSYIKGPIKKFIAPYFKQATAEQKIKASIEEIRADEYNTVLAIYDDDDLPLLNMTLYSGTRSEAQKAAEIFKKNPEKIYMKIVDILCNNDSNETDQ